MKLPRPEAGDFWGGLAAMLVALPSAIAFGVAIYSPLGASYVAQGALAGILGVTALGLIAPALGGTNRLITAPCAPAAAVLSAFAIEFMYGGGSVESALLMVSMLGLLAGLLQIFFGTIRLGQLIKYMPYPVVSGYLSGVGLIIIASQVPKFLGAPKGAHFWESLAAPELWKWQSMVVGVCMIGRSSFHYLRQRSTILDFAVIAVVVATALTVSLIAASGVGIVLAVLLFIREQIGGTIVRRKVYCNQVFSKHVRTHEEMEILVARGERGVVVELQGSLFFGTTNQLYSALEPELKTQDYVILDMRRVQSVDVTAAHMLAACLT